VSGVLVADQIHIQLGRHRGVELSTMRSSV
jgi:hypothetical protein